MSVRYMVVIGLFIALFTLSSVFPIYIPISPVPITLHVFFVMLSGVILGKKFGTISVVIWILIGIFGLPVFSGGKSGIMVILGPTGGFLVGFIVCSYIVGYMVNRFGYRLNTIILSGFIGLLFIYIIGCLGFFGSFYFLHKPITLLQSIKLSVFPFIPFDIVKIFFSSLICFRVHKSLKESGYSLL
ncbi:MAG: biotin transporter BioY [Caldisericia bacterium]|nr:biotin transporter BioY [Caldisericia bacterium]